MSIIVLQRRRDNPSRTDVTDRWLSEFEAASALVNRLKNPDQVAEIARLANDRHREMKRDAKLATVDIGGSD